MLSLILLFQKFSHEHPGHVFRIVTLKYKYYSMKVLHWWCFWYSYCMQFKLQKKLRNLQWQTFSQMYMMFPHPISTSRRNCLERQSEDTHGTTHQMFLPRLWRFFLYLESTSNKGWICSLEFFVITTIVIERFNACSFKGNMQLALSKVYFIQCWYSKDVSSCTFCPIYDSDTNSTSLQLNLCSLQQDSWRYFPFAAF